MTSPIDKAIQQKLADLGFYKGEIDGDQGPLTTDAVKKFQLANGLRPDGVVGPHTIFTLIGRLPTEPVATRSPHLDGHSAAVLKTLEPDLAALVARASGLVAISLLDGRRNREDQEKAFKLGNSKVHFGESAHNYDPAIAVDIVPNPLDWSNRESFLRVQRVIGFWNPKTRAGKGLAKDMGISIRWGGDWNMDGNISDGWDFPHYERYPWRKFAQQSKLYKG